MEKTGFSVWAFSSPSLLLVLLLSLAWNLCLPRQCGALPPGSATFSLQYRLFDTNPQEGPSVSYSASNYSLSLTQESVNWGNLSGFINWADEPDYHRVGSWLIESKDLFFNGFRLNSGFGDNILRLSLIGDFPFRFSNLVDPDTVVEGARIHLASERGELELFGGNVVALTGAFATGVEYLDETMVGVRSRYSLLPGVRLGCQILRTGRAQEMGEEDFPTTTVFRRNDIFGFSAEIEPWPGYRLLQGELSLSHYQKREEDGDRAKGWDYSLILGPSLRRPQFTFEANVRHIGANYQPFSRFIGGNVEGFFFAGEYRPCGFLSLFASADRSRDNLADDPDLATIDTKNGIAGFRLGAPPFPLLNLRYGITEAKSQPHSPTKTDSGMQNWTGEVTYSYGSWYPILRYQRFDYEDQASPSSDYQSDLYFLELRRSFANASYAWVNGGWTRYGEKSPGSVSDGYTVRLGADYRPISALEIRGEASYSRSRDDVRLTDMERKGILVSLSTFLPWGFTLYVEYQYGKVNDEIGTSGGNEHRIYVQTSQRFNWGKPVAVRAPIVTGAPPPGYGTILGYAFSDRNGNGIREEGEPPIPGVRVQLEDGTVATSDESGKFSFVNVVMGEHTVAVDSKKVPIEYDFAGEAKQKLEVKRRGTSEADFAFQLLGKIGGRVIEDTNANGKIEEGEKGIANALVFATLGGKELSTYTDENGNFLFENLRGGAYRITLDVASLVEGAEITSQETFNPTLLPGGELTGFNFLVHVKPRPVIKKIFGEPEGGVKPPQSDQTERGSPKEK